MNKSKPRKEVDFQAYLDQKLEDPEWVREFTREYENIKLTMDIPSPDHRSLKKAR